MKTPQAYMPKRTKKRHGPPLGDSSKDKRTEKRYEEKKDRVELKEKVLVLKEFIGLANIVDFRGEIPLVDRVRQKGNEVVWPEEYQDFFKEFYKKFRETIFWKTWVSGGGIPQLDMIRDLRKLLKGGKPRFPYTDQPPRFDMYTLYYETREILDCFNRYRKNKRESVIRKSVSYYLPIQRTIDVNWEFGKIVVQTGSSNSLESCLDALVWALEGLPADRVRACPVCPNFYWAKKIDSPACSPKHVKVERTRRWRKGGEKYRG